MLLVRVLVLPRVLYYPSLRTRFRNRCYFFVIVFIFPGEHWTLETGEGAAEKKTLFEGEDCC